MVEDVSERQIGMVEGVVTGEEDRAG